MPVEKARKGSRAIETAPGPTAAERWRKKADAHQAAFDTSKRAKRAAAASVRGLATAPGLRAAVEFSDSRPLHESLEEVIASKLGGEKVLGRPVRTPEDIVELVRAGLPLRAFEEMRVSGRFSLMDLQDIIPSRTLRHRRENRERLTVEESDRAVRLLRIQTLADMAFGDTRKADRWLRRPSGVVKGETALETANTEAGARVVETVLAKIAWGAAA